MKLNEIPLIGGFYKDEDRDWSVQDCVNYLPTVAETAGTRTQTMLRTAPGLRPFVRLPGAGPCRGVYNCEGRLFTVLGQHLFLIDSNGVATVIGKVPGVQRVQFAHNQATSSGQNQLVIGNGQAGYVYNTNTKEFKRITDEGFIGGISPTFVDSYIVWVSTNRLYMLNSSVSDAAEYNTLDQFQSEYSPDKLVCTIASSSELVAMSERSIEFFQNVGANEQPFRSKGISIDLGAASRWGAVICDFSLFFLASDGTFRRIDNYNATRISTGPVEQAIRDLDWTQAQAYVWEEGRYKVVYWTFPDGYTFGWDIANGMWHRRVSYGLNRWRVSSTARWNGKTIAGDFQRGDLWVVDSNYFLEGDQEYNCEITGPYIHGDGNLVKMPRMDLIMQTGQADTLPAQFPVQPNALSIIGDMPDLVVGAPLTDFKYVASGGVPPYGAFTISSGSLPAGLTLNSDGTVTGTPTTASEYSWTIRIEDSEGGAASKVDDCRVVVGNVSLSLVMNLPPAGPTGCIAWSPDSQYLAISSASQSPYLWVYKRTGETLALLTIPATGMTSRAQGLAWSPDGNELSVAPEFSVPPFLLRRTGDAFILETLGDQLPLAQERGLVYSPSGSNLMLTYPTAIYGWSVSAGTYSPTGKSADLPGSGAFTLEASGYAPDGSMFMTGLSSSPWGALYSAAGSALTSQPLMGSVSSEVRQPRFSPQSKYVGWATGSSPFVKLYQRTGTSFGFTEVSGIPVADSTSASFAWSPTTANFAVGGDQLRIYRNSGMIVTINTTYPVSGAVGISWTKDGKYIAVLRNGGTTVLKADIT